MLKLTLSWIWHHPLGKRHRLDAYQRYIYWQARCQALHDEVGNGTCFLLEPGVKGATGNFYCGLHEWPDMAFVLHLLRPEDTFADIGANVGS